MFDNPIIFIAVSCLVLAAGGVIYAMLMSFGMMLGTNYVGKKKVKEYLMVLETDLPGKNCGDCGYATCAQCAEAMLFQDVDCTQCPHCDIETMKELRETVTRYWFLVETSNIPLTKREEKKIEKRKKEKVVKEETVKE